MTEELVRKLVAEFTWLPDCDLGFRWFEANDGSYNLMRDFCRECESLARGGGFFDRLYVGEIKQKMGFLEMWVRPMREGNGMLELYLKYRKLSAVTCERCGEAGRHQLVHDWIFVLCRRLRWTVGRRD